MTAATKVRGPWAMPDAVQVLPADVDRLTWLAERRKGLGSSDASTIAGVNRYSSRYELYLDKTGRLPDRDVTRRMEVGTRIEPVLRQWFTDEQGIEIRRQGLVRSRRNPIQQASLDGLTSDGGIFEGKFTGLAVEWEDGQVPDHAEIQVQHALGVTGRSHAWVAALIDGWNLDFVVRRVDRNQGLIDLLTTMGLDFWDRYILTDTVPPIEAAALDVVKARWAIGDGALIAAAAPNEWDELRAEYDQATVAMKAAKARKDTVDARIRDLIGEATQLSVLGETVATLKNIVTHRIDSKRLRDEQPAIAGQYTTESISRRLALTKEK